MPATVVTQINGQGPNGPINIQPAAITIAAPVDAKVPYTIVSGNNTITVPAASTSMHIIPPVSNTLELILKGIAGDTGIPISPNQPFGPWIFDPSHVPATVVLNAANNVTGPVVFIFE